VSDTQYNSHDQAVINQLEHEFGLNSVEHAVLFQRTLELDATSKLLEAMALSWVENDNNQPIALPYVEMLVHHRGERFARDFVRNMCVTERDFGQDGWHRQAFWNDRATQLLLFRDFATLTASLSFAQALAECDPNELLSKYDNVLTEWFDRIEAKSWQLKKVVEAAVRKLEYIGSREELDAALQHLHAKKDLQRVAARCPSSGWNLVLKAWSLAKHPAHCRENQVIENDIYQQVMDYPHQGAIIYRWLMEGFTRYAEQAIATHPDPLTITAEQLARHSFESGLYGLTSNGWQVLTLDRNLRVRLSGKNGMPIVLQHDATSVDAEPLQEGDEVIVAKRLTDSLTPKVTPGGRVFTLVLSPARRPTSEMLDNSQHHFYVGKIRPVNWRR
jgi:hypothetical protein